MKLNVGCGPCLQDGFIGMDSDPESKATIICDANQIWPIENDSVEEIYSTHFLEHIRDVQHVLNEMHRICINGAKIFIAVPVMETVANGHIQCFTPGYFHKFVDQDKFDIEHIQIKEILIDWFFPGTTEKASMFIYEKQFRLTVKK
jgi:predicted SAM-dependent methyltransferase